MVATMNLNPVVTTFAAGTFGIDWVGGMQGTFLADPAARYDLAGGILAPTETLPMWGGVGISESSAPIAATGVIPHETLGGYITRATTVTQTSANGLTGFSVFDQAHAMINSPQSPVPLALSYMGVHFFRLGSGARIWVACDPSLVSLDGLIISQQVSWDFNNQVLQPYDASTPTYSITSQTWSSANGGQVAVVAASATPVAGVGDSINISGTTNAGTGGTTTINTNHVVNTFTDNQHFTYLLPGTAAQYGAFGGTQVLNYGTGALSVKVLNMMIGNSMTVSFDPVTGFATWNRVGSTALILI